MTLDNLTPLQREAVNVLGMKTVLSRATDKTKDGGYHYRGELVPGTYANYCNATMRFEYRVQKERPSHGRMPWKDVALHAIRRLNAVSVNALVSDLQDGVVVSCPKPSATAQPETMARKVHALQVLKPATKYVDGNVVPVEWHLADLQTLSQYEYTQTVERVAESTADIFPSRSK